MPIDRTNWPTTFVEVAATRDPAGRECVLVQLEYGFVLLLPRDAIEVAAMIDSTAREIGAE